MPWGSGSQGNLQGNLSTQRPIRYTMHTQVVENGFLDGAGSYVSLCSLYSLYFLLWLLNHESERPGKNCISINNSLEIQAAPSWLCWRQDLIPTVWSNCPGDATTFGTRLVFTWSAFSFRITLWTVYLCHFRSLSFMWIRELSWSLF